MKKVLKLALAIALTVGATSLYAQKFGRINTQDVLVNMSEFKEMQTTMQAFEKELQENMEAISVELNNKLQDFQKNEKTYAESVRDSKYKDIQALQVRLQQFEGAAQEDYNKRSQELMTPIYAKAKEAIDKVSKAGGFLAIFDITTGSMAYFDEVALTDITPEVKKSLGITATATPAAAPAAAK